MQLDRESRSVKCIVRTLKIIICEFGENRFDC